MTTERTRYESHTWNPTEPDDECIVCGVTWGECEDDCPGGSCPTSIQWLDDSPATPCVLPKGHDGAHRYTLRCPDHGEPAGACTGCADERQEA